jgi:alkyl hydroperoxide reductase subunit D
MLAEVRDQLPAHARDLRLNLSAVGGPSELTPQQSWGAALAAAISTRNRDAVRAIEGDAAAHLDDAAFAAARAAASLMAMNNVYYRATHWLGGEYQKLPARLRMQTIANPGVDKLDFELWCLAASAVNGCEACVVSHEREVRARGATVGMVQDTLRTAAIVAALGTEVAAR